MCMIAKPRVVNLRSSCRRRSVITILAAAVIPAPASAIDLALSANAAAFVQHLVVGGPSYDAFTFDRHDPVYTGSGYFPWVVNGFLYELAPGNSSEQCILAGEYPQGYFTPAHPAHMRALNSDDGGMTFVPGPIVVAGNASLYDQGGATPDGSAVIDGAVTHIVHDWATPSNNDGGLGSATGPLRGQFERDPAPIVSESTMPPPPLPQYRRVYGGTLLRRGDSDWMILAAISTAHNAGGTWGLCAMTAPSPRRAVVLPANAPAHAAGRGVARAPDGVLPCLHRRARVRIRPRDEHRCEPELPAALARAPRERA